MTARESQVLEAVLAGFSSKLIGLRFGISARTVAFHRANIHAKYRTAFLAEEGKP